MFVRWWGGGGWAGHKLAPHPTNVYKISRVREKPNFFSVQQITFKLGNSTNLIAIFGAELADFP